MQERFRRRLSWGMQPSLLVAVAVVTILGMLAGCAPGAAPASKTGDASKPAAAGTATASQSGAKPLEKVKVQVPTPSVSFLHYYVGKEKGIFQQEGLDLDIVVLSPNLATSALLKGEVDFIDVLQPSLNASLKGEPLRVVVVHKARTSWRIILGQGVTSAEQIKGKAVGLTTAPGSANHFAVEKALISLGLNPKDVTYTNIPATEMLAALKSGAAAAAGLSPPFGEMAIASGFKELMKTSDVVHVVTGGVSATTQKIKDNPDQVKRFIRASLKSLAYIRDHKAEAVELTAKQFTLDNAVAEEVVTNNINESSSDGGLGEQALPVILEATRFQGGAGLEDATLEQISKGFDFSLLREAQKELGLSR